MNTGLKVKGSNSNQGSDLTFRPVFHLLLLSYQHKNKSSTAKIVSLLHKKWIPMHLLPQSTFHSLLRPVTQAQGRIRLGLAHREHNGSGGGILDLSYSCATTSTCFLHRDRLLAPNAISSTDRTYISEGACARPGARWEHKRPLGIF